MIKDQADKLRDMIEGLKPNKSDSNINEESVTFENKCRVITVTSGKGGVGKTSLSVNLGIQLSKMGYKVVVFDADFGLANVDILFGISPKYTLLDVINSNKTIFDIIIEGPSNTKFISGGSGLIEMTRLKNWQIEMVIKKISNLDVIADIIIVDTGAGVADNVKKFLFASDEIILVTAPEPTAIMDAYAMVKAVSSRNKRIAVRLVINRGKNIKESVNASKKLTTAAEKFLGINIQTIGHILYDEVVIKSVKEQYPFILGYPNSNISHEIEKIAERLINNNNIKEDDISYYKGFKGFLNRFSGFFNIG